MCRVEIDILYMRSQIASLSVTMGCAQVVTLELRGKVGQWLSAQNSPGWAISRLCHICANLQSAE